MYRTLMLVFLLSSASAWASEVPADSKVSADNATVGASVDVPAAVSAGGATPLPNIVVILADDLGWNDLGYQGSEIRTPRIDAIAHAGLRLNRFYAQPMCSPTRATLLTGKSAARLGITRALSKLNPTGLPLEQRILPQFLKDMGYQTSLVGKWHLGFHQRAYLPTSRGFDSFYGNLTGGIGYWDHVNGGGYDWQRFDAQGNGEVLREAGYTTHLLADEAVRMIENRNPDQPLFLYASFNAPHHPNEAPDEAIAAYADIEDPRRRLHAAMVTELDTGVGNIIDALEEQGILDNTLIWFMSDNGGLNQSAFPEGAVSLFTAVDEWFANNSLPSRTLEFFRVYILEGGSDNRPLRSGKGTVYEGGVRVPSFLYWRGELQPRQVDAMVTTQDVLPSLLAMLKNDERDAEFDGVNRWSLLQDGTQTEAPDYMLVASDSEALIQYPWKIVRLGSDDIELYNVETDPGEQNNLAELSGHALRRDDMLLALDAQPRGERVGLPLYEVFWDMDSFGGEEDREPWAEIIQ